MSLIYYDHHGIQTRLSLSRRRLWGNDEDSKFNAEMSKLQNRSNRLRDAIDMNRYALCCLDLVSRQLSDHESNVPAPARQEFQPFSRSRPSMTISDETLEIIAETQAIERRQEDMKCVNEIWKSTSRINCHLISSDTPNTPNSISSVDRAAQVCGECPISHGHGIFFRVFSDTANSPYDNSTGIRYSGWRQSSSRFPKVTKEQVLDHMNDVGKSSPFISMTDSPARLVNFGANRWKLTKVAVINATKMERLGIKHARTTQLAEEFGFGSKSNSRPDGAKYLNSAHWLAQFWIPAECIERVMGFGDFMKVCLGQGIINGNYEVDTSRYDQKLSWQNLLPASKLSCSGARSQAASANELVDSMASVSFAEG